MKNILQWHENVSIVDYAQAQNFKHFVGAPRIELGPLAPKASILPIYYAPTKRSKFQRNNSPTLSHILKDVRMSFIPSAHRLNNFHSRYLTSLINFHHHYVYLPVHFDFKFN